MEVEYDDIPVTLGDGSVTADQGVHGIQKVAGSRTFCRDPRLSALAKGRPGASRPEHGHVRRMVPGMKWCSENDHWDARERFSDDPRYADGKKPICKTCCARLERRRYALMREAQGHVVRPYGERKRA